MSKIAIISRPDKGVLIDVGGCSTMQEAIGHLTSTLQVSSQFWQGVAVALNLGNLELSPQQVAQLLAIAKGVGAPPREVFATNDITRKALQEQNVILGKGAPMTLPKLSDEQLTHHQLAVDADEEACLDEEDRFDAASENAVTVFLGTPEIEELNAVQRSAGKREIDLPLSAQPTLPQTMYLKQTLRSGQTVSHKGHLVIVGDVNPGAEVMAEGDITVWGALRGIAHAGIGGNVLSEIRALKLQPIQIRIAHAIARAPDKPRVKYASKAGPDVVKIIDGKVRISGSASGSAME